MLIKLKRTWFCPDASGITTSKYVQRNGRPAARGSRLRKGEHEVPDEWRDQLPPDAIVLSDDDVVDEEEQVWPPIEDPVPDTFSELARADMSRAAFEQERLVRNQAEADEKKAQTKRNRQAAAAKARAAKQVKQENPANA